MNNLELHYYLEDGKHSMDALVKNRAEHELLKMINEVAILLDLDLSIDVEAMEPGGIREVINFFSKKENKHYLVMVTFLSGIIATILTTVISNSLTKDNELDNLTKEEKRLNIQKLKKELDNSASADHILIIESLTQLIKTDYKVRVHKSRFYDHILKESKLYRLSITELNNDDKDLNVEHSIDRVSFKEQILDEENSEMHLIEDAHIEVVAPVLTKSEMKWRGVYHGKIITFDLKDTGFKNAVLNKKYSFSSGTSIKCKLAYKEGLNEQGNFIMKDISVFDVVEVFEGKTITYTEKSKKAKAIANQTSFQFRNEE